MQRVKGRGLRLVQWGTALGILVLLTALWVLRARPPQFHGKPAAHWFVEFSKARSKYQVTVRLPGGRVFQNLDEFGLSTDPAADSLRMLGTNAALYLNRRIENSLSPFNKVYEATYFKLPGWLRQRFPPPPSAEADAVAMALVILRSDAAPAIPTVIRALSQGTPFQRMVYLNALRQLQYEPEDLDPTLEWLLSGKNVEEAVRLVTTLHVHTETATHVLLQGMSGTNSIVATSAWTEAAHFGHYANLLFPALTRSLATGDANARVRVLCTVAQFGPDASPVLADLIHSLHDPDGQVRYESARALEAMGTNAMPALAELCRATNDSSLMVQRCSARVISNLTCVLTGR